MNVHNDGEILAHLVPLVGLKLSIAGRAANMRNFYFSDIRAVTGGTVGEYALHIQCPWRIEGPKGIVTGSRDLWKPIADKDVDYETWDYDKDGNIQDRQIGILLGGYDQETGSYVNNGNDLIVEAVHSDVYGGAMIVLSGGYRIVLFPAETEGEDWRIFRTDTDEPHFVVAAGRVEK